MSEIITWDILRNRAYTPYSNSELCCILIDSESQTFPGVRIENASFPDTISSIQSAVYSCISEGKTPNKVLLPSKTHDLEKNQLNFFVEAYDLTIEIIDSIEIKTYKENLTEKRKISVDVLKSLIPLAQIEESNFPVSCIIKTKSSEYKGVNIEQKDWRMGLCAERVALSKAISNGDTDFEEIHIYTPKSDFCSPCGACRQVLMEHFLEQRMFMYHKSGLHSEIISYRMLPYSFKLK